MIITYKISAEIVQPPSDTTVFLGESAVFECVLNSDFSGWRVNGTPFDRLDLDIRNDLMTPDQPNTKEGNILIQLIIPARAEYNGTRVQCVIPGHKSENVTMNIQGIYIYIFATYTCRYTYMYKCYIYTMHQNM